jgi:hypothetical protein
MLIHGCISYVQGTPTYELDFIRSNFCLAATGGGHGKRSVLATLLGCAPVITSPEVYQPFEPEMNWDDFSVRVTDEELSRLPQILDAFLRSSTSTITPRMACAARHLQWSSYYGGSYGEDGRYDAFYTTMEILRVRLVHPLVHPSKYASLDERFGKFMHCELGETPRSKTSLCTRASNVDQSVFPTLPCPSRRGPFGIAGGAICHGKPSLAVCPRLNE